MTAIPAGAVVYQPRGAALDLFRYKGDEAMLSGPAGTGKSRAGLEKVNALAVKYPGARLAIVRKTRSSLTETALVTFEQHVRPPCDTTNQQRRVRQSYVYPNGSEVIVAGLDNPIKIMSAEFDVIYVLEATEVSVTDWEFCSTRLRNGVIPYQQLLGDCNPGPPSHWLKRRMDQGLTTMLQSRHEDNPRLYHPKTGEITPFGAAYMGKLDKLTGVRYLRLRKGIWAASEGMVYDDWDPSKHHVNVRDLGWYEPKDEQEEIQPWRHVPKHWRRIRVVDFGFTNPFVCQWWAIDGDGRMYLYRELYRTRTLVEDHARRIRQLEAETGEEIEATVCDHDAEDRATLERHLGCETLPAHKDISTGVQQTQSRFRAQEDGRPRIFILQNCLVELDPLLSGEENTRNIPTSTAGEIEGYEWDKKTDGSLKEVPVKKNDHGMDPMRYAVAYVDGLGERQSLPPSGVHGYESDSSWGGGDE